MGKLLSSLKEKIILKRIFPLKARKLLKKLKLLFAINDVHIINNKFAPMQILISFNNAACKIESSAEA